MGAVLLFFTCGMDNWLQDFLATEASSSVAVFSSSPLADETLHIFEAITAAACIALSFVGLWSCSVPTDHLHLFLLLVLLFLFCLWPLQAYQKFCLGSLLGLPMNECHPSLWVGKGQRLGYLWVLSRWFLDLVRLKPQLWWQGWCSHRLVSVWFKLLHFPLV